MLERTIGDHPARLVAALALLGRRVQHAHGADGLVITEDDASPRTWQLQPGNGDGDAPDAQRSLQVPAEQATPAATPPRRPAPARERRRGRLTLRPQRRSWGVPYPRPVRAGCRSGPAADAAGKLPENASQQPSVDHDYFDCDGEGNPRACC